MAEPDRKYLDCIAIFRNTQTGKEARGEHCEETISQSGLRSTLYETRHKLDRGAGYPGIICCRGCNGATKRGERLLYNGGINTRSR